MAEYRRTSMRQHKLKSENCTVTVEKQINSILDKSAKTLEDREFLAQQQGTSVCGNVLNMSRFVKFEAAYVTS